MSYSRMERLNKELERAISEEDFELALESIEDMIELEAENAQLLNSRGVVLAKMKRFPEALVAFDAALRLDQNISRVWYSKGVVLMDTGSLRQALACFYKALDLEPAYEKARERFVACLDELVLRAHVQTEPGIEGPTMPGPGDERIVPPPGEGYEDEVHHEPPVPVPREEGAEPPVIGSPRARKKRGTYLDDDMFGEDEATEEDWDEGVADEGPPEDGEHEGSDEEADWGEGGDFENWEEKGEASFIRCRCGADIGVDSDERPFKFRCESCGRTGTLK